MRIAIVVLIVVVFSLSVVCYKQNEKLNAYRELVRVSDTVISLQEENLLKQEKVIELLNELAILQQSH